MDPRRLVWRILLIAPLGKIGGSSSPMAWTPGGHLNASRCVAVQGEGKRVEQKEVVWHWGPAEEEWVGQLLPFQRESMIHSVGRHTGEERGRDMAFSHTNTRGNTYYLHATTRKLKSGKEQKLYFFAKTERDGALEEVPEGYEVTETKNGLPVLKRAQK